MIAPGANAIARAAAGTEDGVPTVAALVTPRLSECPPRGGPVAGSNVTSSSRESTGQLCPGHIVACYEQLPRKASARIRSRTSHDDNPRTTTDPIPPRRLACGRYDSLGCSAVGFVPAEERAPHA